MSADHIPAKRTGESVRCGDILHIKASCNSSVGAEKEGDAAGYTSKGPLLDRKTPGKPLAGRRRSSTALSSVERVLKTHQRLRSTISATVIASIPTLVGGYTIVFPSSALLDLTGDVEGLPKDYRLNTLLSELFAVRS